MIYINERRLSFGKENVWGFPMLDDDVIKLIFEDRFTNII